MSNEADALADMYEDPNTEGDADRAFEIYHRNKDAKVRSTIRCPICEKRFRKRSYQHAFCSNKGGGNCKDRYWNIVDPERLARAKQFA